MDYDFFFLFSMSALDDRKSLLHCIALHCHNISYLPHATPQICYILLDHTTNIPPIRREAQSLRWVAVIGSKKKTALHLIKQSVWFNF